MKLKKSFISALLALTILCSAGFAAFTQYGCLDTNNDRANQIGNGDTNDNSTYTVTLHLNGGSLKDGQAEVDSYKSGTEITLPIPERAGYKFGGWYESDDFSGSPITKIPATATGNKNYYAKWTISEENGDTDKPDDKAEIYLVYFYVNYGDADKPFQSVEVKHGTAVAKPSTDPKREGHDFTAWYEDANGKKEYDFTKPVTKSFSLYAQWKAKTYKVTLNLNGGKIASGANITSYTYGKGATLPVLEKSGYVFMGWYNNASFEGEQITKITTSDFGDKTYYAKFTQVTSLNVTSVGGYEEGAYIELDHIANTSALDYTVSYKLATSGVNDYKAIDSELVRVNGNKVRADIVGLPKGKYTIKVAAKNLQVEKTVDVTAYDRNGYAHFGYSGIGAYEDNGTLKKDAAVVYVTEETKNTVTLKISNKNYVGIANILSAAQKLNGTPLVIRIIGTVGAATWNEINYDKGGNYSDGVDYDGNNKLPAQKVIGKNGKQLPTDHKDITQAELIAGGYNTLNTSVYSELEGLSSKATWSSGEYDSAWNNCGITNASNVTVEGIGTDARIFQWGFTWKQCNSIEVRNLTFEDYPEDACSFEGGVDATNVNGFDCNRIWVHHNTFLEGKNYWDVCPEQDKHEGDGATDFKRNSYVTISYNHYFENHKTGLVGGGDTQKTACLTFHHNWYEDCSSRLPLARQANMHMYNNYYDGTTGTNMSLRAGAYAFIEYCYFDKANNPIVTEKKDNKNGVAKVYECKFSGKEVGSSYLNKTVFIVTDRTKAVENDNIYNKTFDTDSSYFYYDSSAKTTLLKNGFAMLTAEQTKAQVPTLAGVHKK